MGRAIALGLARAGHDVAVHYRRSKGEAEAVAGEIAAMGRRAAALAADLSKESDVATLVARASAALGPLALLVNCASAFEPDDVDTMTRASWDAHIAINLRAPLKLIQDFARAAQPGASIVNILDQRVLKPTPQFLSYAASKAALHALTVPLAQALGPRGIRVNAIGPGPTFRNARQSDADFRAQGEATILGRGADPKDIVDAVLYLAGAAAVTGQMIAVDGGQHLVWRTPDVLGKE
jgi:NAD(P)-dependent dehydrogenase (short-subunit alcohol dehydrogenase family)